MVGHGGSRRQVFGYGQGLGPSWEKPGPGMPGPAWFGAREVSGGLRGEFESHYASGGDGRLNGPPDRGLAAADQGSDFRRGAVANERFGEDEPLFCRHAIKDRTRKFAVS